MPLKSRPLFMISVVAQQLRMHPQTLRLYEREGFIRPSRTRGNTRLYSQQDIEQLELILRLTRELGVNLAGVEVILDMRRRYADLQHEHEEFKKFVQEELGVDISRWKPRKS